MIAKEQGLKYYRILLEQIKKINLTSFIAILEINPEQVRLLQEISFKIDPKIKLEVKKDLSGKDRIVKLFFN